MAERGFGFSALQRAEIAENYAAVERPLHCVGFSALQRAEIAEIFSADRTRRVRVVSVLFNEPKLLKAVGFRQQCRRDLRFSALQRAEIAENPPRAVGRCAAQSGFSALQRAEIAEMSFTPSSLTASRCFSALQRAEIAETRVSNLRFRAQSSFSALQRAEIAETTSFQRLTTGMSAFQCSSTSRNC